LIEYLDIVLLFRLTKNCVYPYLKYKEAFMITFMLAMALQSSEVWPGELYVTVEAPFGYNHELNGTEWIALEPMGVGPTDSYILAADYRRPQSGSWQTVWIRTDHQRDSSVPYRTRKMRIQFDCNERTSLVAYVISYDSTGGVMDSWSGTSVREPIIPGSVGERWIAKACHEA
jgi:hypothetical protein